MQNPIRPLEPLPLLPLRQRRHPNEEESKEASKAAAPSKRGRVPRKQARQRRHPNEEESQGRKQARQRRRRRHQRASSFAVLTDRSMDRRPSFAVSPRRHRASAAAGRPLLASSAQTPLGSIKKAQTPMRSSICALPRSSRLEPSPREKLDFAAAPTPTRAAGKENLHAHDEVALNLAAAEAMNNWRAAPTSPLFERGRLYDLYSARRNERLKRKHGFPSGEEEAEAMAEDPCVAVELSKRRGAKKSAESVRRSMPAADFPGSRAGGLSLRSSLRSSKEMKKASAAAAKSSAVKERRVSTRSSARRI